MLFVFRISPLFLMVVRCFPKEQNFQPPHREGLPWGLKCADHPLFLAMEGC
jgi:hypothetical protein